MIWSRKKKNITKHHTQDSPDVLGLVSKDLKASNYKKVQRLKENKFKELKESMVLRSEAQIYSDNQVGNCRTKKLKDSHYLISRFIIKF